MGTPAEHKILASSDQARDNRSQYAVHWRMTRLDDFNTELLVNFLKIPVFPSANDSCRAEQSYFNDLLLYGGEDWV
jgi:hypothetical protein